MLKVFHYYKIFRIVIYLISKVSSFLFSDVYILAKQESGQGLHVPVLKRSLIQALDFKGQFLCEILLNNLVGTLQAKFILLEIFKVNHFHKKPQIWVRLWVLTRQLHYVDLGYFGCRVFWCTCFFGPSGLFDIF